MAAQHGWGPPSSVCQGKPDPLPAFIARGWDGVNRARPEAGGPVSGACSAPDRPLDKGCRLLYNPAMHRRWTVLLLLASGLLAAPARPAAAQDSGSQLVEILPGDSWASLAWRYRLEADTLQRALGSINGQRQPVVGSQIAIPTTAPPRQGMLLRASAGGLLAKAALLDTSPWKLALENGLDSPYQPLMRQPIFFADETSVPRDLPDGFRSLTLRQHIATPGDAVAFAADAAEGVDAAASVGGSVFNLFSAGERLVGLAGTGAFFRPGTPELTIQVAGAPLWSQPIRFQDREWSWDQLTLSGDAAAIDQESIARERARLFEIWDSSSPEPLWQGEFRLPSSSFLEISSYYGARRSYNGGPYDSYHEGVDFSAYGGSEAFAAAAGRVVIAEPLYVRGNGVIIDHGLGIYTGYYHLSALAVEAGQMVSAGETVGLVGSTGLSTGNHLHWDLLASGVWVNGESWIAQGMGCWLLAALGQNCPDES